MTVVTNDMTAPPNIIVVMGVSGSGKSIVGEALAAALRWPFLDGDSFHTPENVAKMHRGEGLTDADRQPWLDRLASLITHAVRADEQAVLACSALKHAYREQFRAAASVARPAVAALRFVYLDVPEAVLGQRLASRHDHYAGRSLLSSQLATLEPPRDALWVDGTQPIEAIVRRIRTDMRI